MRFDGMFLVPRKEKNLWHAYAACQREGAVRLFDCGHAQTRGAYPWATEHPGLRRLPAQEGAS